MTRKSCVAPDFDHLDPRNAMMPLMIPLASYNMDVTPMVLHDQKHVAPYFSCLDLRNAMVPLTTLLGSFDTNSSANCVNGKKNDINTSFQFS